VTQRLQETFLDKVKIGHIGSDVLGLIGAEFFVNPQTLNEIFLAPFKGGEHALPLSFSFGFFSLEGKSQTDINILKHSSIVLNKAKKNLNANFEYYAPEMGEETTWRLEMIRQLIRDFEAKRLQLWYQPQVDLVTEKIVGMEALLS
jgi:predicted signal transduction protein with EAL and GGDEF domain